jgi:cytochrome c
MVTPKMSIRRHVVIKTYEEIINGLYEGGVDAESLLNDGQQLKAA